MKTNNIRVFASQFREKELNIVFTEESLWLSSTDICSIFSISEEQLKYELMKIFSDGVFSRKDNRQRFLIGEKKKMIECYRIEVIISLGYRMKLTTETKYIIHTNRTIKTKLLSKTNMYSWNTRQNQCIEEKEKSLALFDKAIHLVRALIHNNSTKIYS